MQYTIMKKMKESQPLIKVWLEKITKQSARKTVVKKLKSSGVPKCERDNITGHSSTPGLNDYDYKDKLEQQMISRIVGNGGPTTSRVIFSQLYPSNSSTSTLSCAPSHMYNFIHCSITLNIARNDAVQKKSDIIRG